MKLLTDDGARIAVVSICLMACCSSLLGVIMGWWLRGYQVRQLRWKVAYLQGELRRCWAGKVKKMPRKRIVEGRDGGENGGE